MRITFVLHLFPRGPIGGFRVVYEYANRLAATGCEVTVVHERWRGDVREAMRDLWHGRSQPRLRAAVTWFEIDPRVRLMIVPELKPENLPPADVTIATHWPTARLLPHVKSTPFHLVQNYDTWDGVEELHEVLKMDVPKIAVSGFLARTLEDLGNTTVTVIPNGLDHDTFQPPTTDLPRGDTVAMLISKHPSKGFATGMKALEQVRNKIPGLRVNAFGVRPRPGDLPEWMTYHHGLEGKTLVENVYHRSAVFLCSSSTEGWGLPAAEAMACGTAVVSTRNGGVEDFCTHNENGLLCDSTDSAGLAQAVTRMLEDDELRTKCVEAGYLTAARMDWSASARSLMSFIRAFHSTVS
ncbi:glycosyltransferase family 4 protein [Lentzea sp. NPDC051838]|uniref:glycosyltransferase family 4 protein n=1 Tax=Lentzea sp. NPDC051838 TaxID=3154849 RepID=UPI0034292713